MRLRAGKSQGQAVNKRRLLLIPTAVIVVGVAVLGGVNGYLRHWSAQPLPVLAATEFIVPPGTTFSALAETLAEASVVDVRRFSLRAWQRGVHTTIQSGEYHVVPGETADGLLDRLTSGDVMVHRFRIVEGSTVGRVLERLAADERLDFDLAGATVDDLMVRLGLPDDHAEGRFFPDTYQFTRDHKASALLRRAFEKMNEVLHLAWAGRDAAVDYAEPYEALILASIVEKEAGAMAERVGVAGVFTRRLARGMRLQADPTVIYGLGSAFDGNLTRQHLDADGPYNTYQRAGLPPTPIALPSRSSIDAALHPDAGSALYFVARGDGTSYFSETLAEHNAAVRRYQLP